MSAIPLEDFYPCPVCLGIPLSKLRFQKRGGETLILDHCKRCGGMWFDHQEVNLLRQMPASLLKEKVAFQHEEFMMACHSCHQLMPRSAYKCPHCKHHNLLDCPICKKQMHHKVHGGLNLDVCSLCKGVWFDNRELAQLWSISQSALPGAALVSKQVKVSDVFREPRHYRFDPIDDALDLWIALEVLDAAPEIAWGMAEAAGALAEVSTGFASSLPDAMDILGSGAELSVSAVEGLASVSASIFEILAEVIGGLFDGLDF